jgi:sec-independent protein translocase protein TatA
MFAGHLPEVIIILVIALIFLGPKRLPEAGSSIGKAIREFRHETQNVSDDEPSAQDLPTVPNEAPASPPVVEATVAEAQPVGPQSTSDNSRHQA